MTAPPATPPAPHAAGKPSSWLNENHTLAVGLAFLLIGLYVSPILLGFVAIYTTDSLLVNDGLFDWFVAFAMGSEATLAEFHKILFPVMAAVSVATFSVKPSRSMLTLTGFILIAFCLAIGISVYFDIATTKDRLTGLNGGLTVPLAHAFFARISETLLSFFMMMVGVGISNSARSER